MKHTIDAKNRSIGRVASEAARILQGKDSPGYHPRLLGDSEVEITNIERLKIFSSKLDGKKYYHYSGYLGHLKETTLREALKKSPSWVLRRAVYNMLPKNKLRAKRLQRLIIT